MFVVFDGAPSVPIVTEILMERMPTGRTAEDAFNGLSLFPDMDRRNLYTT